MTPIQITELSCYSVAGFCAVVAPGLTGIPSVIVAGIGAAALGAKAYLSSSPKDNRPPQP